MEASTTESTASVPAPAPSGEPAAAPVLQTPRVAPAEPEEEEPIAGEPSSDDGPRPYDFSQQPVLGELERRQLIAEHARFLKSLGIRLTMYLRADCQFDLGQVETTSFRQFLAQLPDSTHLSLFKLENRPGICLWEISPSLASSFTNCLMGNSGLTVEDPPPMTEVELALVDHLTEIILEEWCQTWQPNLEWQAVLLGHETEKHFLRTSSPATAFLILNVQVRLPQTEGSMRLAFPFKTLAPLIQRLREGSSCQSAQDPDPIATDEWNPALKDVDVGVTAELPEMKIPAGHLRDLQVGQELPLPADSIDQVRLLVGGMPRFAGRLGVRGNHWAIQVSRNLEA